MSKILTKKIKVLTSGYIPVRGFLSGPILTPYIENVSTIFLLLAKKIKVVEVLENGKEIPLTFSNYNTDNNEVVKEPKVKKEIVKEEVIETPKEPEPVVENKEEAEGVDIIEATEEEPVEESEENNIEEVTEEHTNPQQKNNFNNYNKKKHKR